MAVATIWQAPPGLAVSSIPRPPESAPIADATLHYERDGWLTALSVSNLFDDRYVSGCNGTAACFYGEGRMAMLTATYKW